jgi:transposase-like protein
MKTDQLPTTLQEAIRYYADEDTCLNFVVTLRWPNGPICPRCQSAEYRFIKTRSMWECKACKKQYSVKVGTIFEDSPITLDKWLCAIWMIVNAKNGVSSYEIGRSLGVTQKTAWFMMHRIRLALHNGSLEKLSGHVEADETLIGGKARNMHRDKQKRMLKEGFFRKAVVMGMLERKGQVRLQVLNTASARLLQEQVRKHAAAGSKLFTDELHGYKALSADYAHHVINHAQKYVEAMCIPTGLKTFGVC